MDADINIGTQIAAKQRLSVSEINKEADIKDKENRENLRKSASKLNKSYENK